MIKFHQLLIILLLFVFFSSCIIGRALVGIGARRGALMALEGGVASSELRLAGMFRGAGISRVGASVIVRSPAVFYSNLHQIRLLSTSGTPQLILESATKPFAEILSKHGLIRLIDSGVEFPIQRNLFSVNGNNVHIRSGAGIKNNSIGILKTNDLVIVLSEELGWYQVQIIKNSSIIKGFISAEYLIPLIIGDANYNNSEFRLEDCSSCKGHGMIYEIITCNYCSNGWNRCYNCNGQSYFTCYNCDGVGELQCYNCRGKGTVHCYGCKDSVNKNCLGCFGDGKVNCNACLSSGKNYCYTCVKTGKLRCNNCQGNGHYKKSIECSNCYGYGKMEAQTD